MAYKVNRYIVVLYLCVAIPPAELEVVDRPKVHNNLVALGQPVQCTELFVPNGIASTTSSMALDQRRSLMKRKSTLVQHQSLVLTGETNNQMGSYPCSR